MGSRTVTHLADKDGVSTGETTVIDTRSLGDAKAEALARLTAQLAAVVAAGRVVTVAGVAKTYQIDDAARANIAGAAILATQEWVWPTGFYWIATDNTHQPMTALDAIGFATNIAIYWSQLVYTGRALKDAIGALSTAQACDDFDVTQGWPANP